MKGEWLTRKKMVKILWTCWFQGRANAPDIVRRCISSWERKNPDWSVRCLDADTVGQYVDVGAVVDLKRQALTAASLSDVIRILLLREYGGVWADATLYCHRPLDDWLDAVFEYGFFAFSDPAPDRLLSSWFLAAAQGNPVVARWHDKVARYWKGRMRSDDYFWFHHEFGELCATDPVVRALWGDVPKVRAEGPHAMLGIAGIDTELAMPQIDWSTPVFKLTYRVAEEDYSAGRLVYDVLHSGGDLESTTPVEHSVDQRKIGSLGPIAPADTLPVPQG